MASVCQVSKLAYSKIISHAFKYPHCAINGLLLASDGANHSSLKIVDAIPLFHHNLGLSPMLEVAFMQVESYCRTCGLVIAGYYQANEIVNECSPDFVSQKVCEKIVEHFPSACLIMVNNGQLSKQMHQPAIYIMQHFDGKWKVKDKDSFKLLPNNNTALELVSNLMVDKQYKDLVDFDDHLDDISQDWLNTSLNEIIEQLSQ